MVPASITLRIHDQGDVISGQDTQRLYHVCCDMRDIGGSLYTVRHRIVLPYVDWDNADLGLFNTWVNGWIAQRVGERYDVDYPEMKVHHYDVLIRDPVDRLIRCTLLPANIG